MIHLRIRRWDSDEWNLVTISGPDALGILQLIGGPLTNSPHEAQILNEEEEWEDLE